MIHTWHRRQCRRKGHIWLMGNHGPFEFVCIRDVCLRCHDMSTWHASTADEATKAGDGGCLHGTPGQRIIDGES